MAISHVSGRSVISEGIRLRLRSPKLLLIQALPDGRC